MNKIEFRAIGHDGSIVLDKSNAIKFELIEYADNGDVLNVQRGDLI